jgi:hypothetical protein
MTWFMKPPPLKVVQGCRSAIVPPLVGNGPPQLSTEPAAATHLPLHLVGLVAVAEAESGSEVRAEEVLLLDGGKDGLVDGLLVAGASAGDNLLL